MNLQQNVKITNTQLRIILRYFANLIKIKEESHGYQVSREPKKQKYV